MTNKRMMSIPSTIGLPHAGDVSVKDMAKKDLQTEPSEADDTLGAINRPGFDLGGSCGDTQAGTGLGLGTDAFDKAGDRRLPGRRPDNKLTIPRWQGPER